MLKLTISDAAEKLGVSKEAIHNRIRRGSLQSVVENGVKFVMLSQQSSSGVKATKQSDKKIAAHTDERYYKFLEEQNSKLQQKVETLQNETRSLRDQKEQMLIKEREKIEQIYKEKDEQLKNIINAISSKFILNAPDESFEAEIEHIEKDEPVDERRLTSLSKYLKSRDFSKKKRIKIKEEFKSRAKDDSRVIVVGKKYYIDLKKYDYSDFSL
ncbi:DNA-binding protein [Sulfurimonas sp.]|uniref:DNA-binding protein n=1 Tax=Sulfurimonas sp. TaxID=2022749 RepID=UPI0025CE0D3D|nr:DNA-binding protein [Sulfurimonas sp.]MCK9453718.1 DNA-binding protein [Sulfurimonas sp.]